MKIIPNYENEDIKSVTVSFIQNGNETNTEIHVEDIPADSTCVITKTQSAYTSYGAPYDVSEDYSVYIKLSSGELTQVANGSTSYSTNNLNFSDLIGGFVGEIYKVSLGHNPRVYGNNPSSGPLKYDRILVPVSKNDSETISGITI